MYIQDIEEIYESTLKWKYFLITTKTDYRKLLAEANNMIKYIYPDRTNKGSAYQTKGIIHQSSTPTSPPTPKDSWAFMNQIQSRQNPHKMN